MLIHLCIVSHPFDDLITATQEDVLGIFFRPVDPVRDMCKDYFDIITTPMDLGKILKRLNEHWYTEGSTG
jgi:hypothetical protein